MLLISVRLWLFSRKKTGVKLEFRYTANICILHFFHTLQKKKISYKNWHLLFLEHEPKI